jgi:hypothetical protein
MWSLLTLTMLGAAPATGLALSAQMGREGTPAAVYLDAIEQELVSSKLAVRRLTLSCDGRRDCLLAGTTAAKLPALVAVTVAYTKKQTTLDLEALRTTDGATVAQLTFSVTARLGETERASLRKFGALLAEALVEVKPDAPVADAPPPQLTPDARPPPLSLTAAPLAPRRSSVPGWVMGGGAVASAVTSGIFLGMASSTRGSLEATPDPSPLTRAQAVSMAAEANRDYSVSLATGLAAGALAAGALIWFLTE